ncbi:hypothetical protein CesoFtcFv8_025066 [Champsocephalus esox]|uniref:Uncharacterized protein n=1 Tax=Champsocephalus esox TaxID=159716 RepID=A0AAN8B3R6_9TELE|nr:hypothetical protein CesoFtcFv8_025066 [Champsocephalus esox]
MFSHSLRRRVHRSGARGRACGSGRNAPGTFLQRKGERVTSDFAECIPPPAHLAGVWQGITERSSGSAFIGRHQRRARARHVHARKPPVLTRVQTDSHSTLDFPGRLHLF